MADPRPPAGLQGRGRAFWRKVVADFDLEAAHFEVLREVCRLLDRQNALAAAVRRDGEVVVGSTGQPRLHPALAESRQTALAIGRLLNELGLDRSDAEENETITTHKARRAAEARWGVHRIDEKRRSS